MMKLFKRKTHNIVIKPIKIQLAGGGSKKKLFKNFSRNKAFRITSLFK